MGSNHVAVTLNCRYVACFEQGVPLVIQANYRVWIHPETRTLSKSSTCSSGFLFFTFSLHKDKQLEKNVIIKWQSFTHTLFYLSAKINP